MTWYTVNASVTVCGWVSVEADTPEDAMAQADHIAASDFEVDMGTAEVEFNIDPAVEESA